MSTYKEAKFRENQREFGCGYWSVCTTNECCCWLNEDDESFDEEIWDEMVNARAEYDQKLREELIMLENELDEDRY